jgi:hypothetical protein
VIHAGGRTFQRCGNQVVSPHYGTLLVVLLQ